MAEKYKFRSKSVGIKALKRLGYRISSGCVYPREFPSFWPAHRETAYTIHIPMAHLSENGLLKFKQSQNRVLLEGQGKLESLLDVLFSRNGH